MRLKKQEKYKHKIELFVNCLLKYLLFVTIIRYIIKNKKGLLWQKRLFFFSWYLVSTR
jgi:hypothetical protein